MKTAVVTIIEVRMAKPHGFDRDAAVRILDKAGWTIGRDGVRAEDGRRPAVEVDFVGTSARKQVIAEGLRADFGRVGIDVRVIGEAESSILARRKNGRLGRPSSGNSFSGERRAVSTISIPVRTAHSIRRARDSRRTGYAARSTCRRMIRISRVYPVLSNSRAAESDTCSHTYGRCIPPLRSRLVIA